MTTPVAIDSFGARPNTPEDTVPAAQKAIAELRAKGGGTLRFPAGTYHFYPARTLRKDYFLSNSDVVNPRRCAMLLEDLHDITIEGAGADEPDAADENITRLLFHGRICPVVADRSRNVTIRDLAIDWARPQNSEGKVVAGDRGFFDVEIDPARYPFAIRDGKLIFIMDDAPSAGEQAPGSPADDSAWWGVMEFDPETRAIPPGTGDGALGDGWTEYRAELLAPNRVRLSHEFRNPPTIGHWLVFRHHQRDHAGMFLTQSENIHVRNVNLRATGGLGILAQYCTNLEFMKVNFTPDLTRRQFLSGRDDGLHFSNCRGRILVDGCSFEGLMDDPMNVHGTSVNIAEMRDSGATAPRTGLRGQFMHPQSVGLPWAHPGDVVAFLDRETLQPTGSARVRAFAPRNAQEFDIEFETPVPAGTKANDAMENMTWTPDLEFRNNRVLSCRARGILISTPGKVMIERNFFKSSGSPILIAGDANYWWESGAVKDVTIRDNDFSDFNLANMYSDCDAIISVAPVIPKPDYRTPFHRNIVIERNVFHPFDYPVLFARSTANLVFRNNTIERSHRYQPWHPRYATVWLESCADVHIGGNRLVGDVLGRNIRLENMPRSEVKLHAGEPLELDPVSRRKAINKEKSP